MLTALAAEPDPHTSATAAGHTLEVHVADSLTGLEVEPLARATRIADVGSGPGFPGLALAVALPHARVDLIESQSRKTAVSGRLIQAARLTNARSVTARVEDWARAFEPAGGREAYDAVTARAVAPLAVLAEYAAPLLRANGVLVAWKGARDREEEAAMAAASEPLAIVVEEVRPVTPFEGAEHRHLHVLRKAGPTPAGLPRRAGMAHKRPFRKGGGDSGPN